MMPVKLKFNFVFSPSKNTYLLVWITPKIIDKLLEEFCLSSVGWLYITSGENCILIAPKNLK